MNRRLKKYADKQSLQYRNEEFLEELKARRCEKKKRYNFFNKKFVSASAALVVLTVCLLCVFLIKPAMDGDSNHQDEPTTPPKKYQAGYHDVVNSNLEEVNEALDYFSFATGEHIQKYTDKEYGDILFYSILYTDEDELTTIDFKIGVNPDYEVVAKLFDKEYTHKGTVAAYEVQYDETLVCEDGIYVFTEKGKITTDREIIYIEAELVRFDENSNFIETLNEIIQAK